MSGVDGKLESTSSVECVEFSGGIVYQSRESLFAINVRDFGARGEGGDDTSAILRAIRAAAEGRIRTVVIPPGDYVITETVELTSRVRILGGGLRTETHGTLAGTRLKKALKGPAIILQNHASVVEGLTLTGLDGNDGDGIVVNANGCSIRNVSVYAMGGDGISVGTHGTNSNFFEVRNCVCRANEGNGCYLHNSGGDANAGLILGLDSSMNHGAGLKLDRASFNTIVNLLVESNGTHGVRLTRNAHRNTFVGGDYDEGNRGFDILVEAGASDNAFFGTGPSASTISDSGIRTKLFAANTNELPTLRIEENNGLIFVGQISGAGEAPGTLTNAPMAGNPTFWLPVLVNGTVRHIPCW